MAGGVEQPVVDEALDLPVLRLADQDVVTIRHRLGAHRQGQLVEACAATVAGVHHPGYHVQQPQPVLGAELGHLLYLDPDNV